MKKEEKKNYEEYLKDMKEYEKEYIKYAKLYEERFGKRAYIAEPSGTKEQTVEAIKVCLEKNEDLLDKLLYPNSEEDGKKGIIY